MTLYDLVHGARKFAVALAAALAILATTLPDGVETSEWIAVALAFLGALGVYGTPNDPQPERPQDV